MGGGGGERVADDDSSGEEDGDEQWRAAINSVACVSSGGAVSGKASRSPHLEDDGDDERAEREPQQLKLYQIKAQKALNDLLEKTLEVVRDPINSMLEDPVSSERGVRLFKHAPPGIVFDHLEKLEGPKKKPRIVPGEEINEKSKRFKKQLQSVAIDGMDILAAAEDARCKCLARMEARDAAAREAAKKEEQRVAELKRIRGERWLPSIAKEMQLQLKTTTKQLTMKPGNYKVSI